MGVTLPVTNIDINSLLTKDNVVRTVDLSAVFGSSLNGVVWLRCRNTHATTIRYVSFLAVGSTDSFPTTVLNATRYNYYLCKVINGSIQYRISAAEIDVRITGYADVGTWETNGIDKSVAAGGWNSIDLSANLSGSETMAFMKLRPTTTGNYQYGVRKGGDATARVYKYYGTSTGAQMFALPLNASYIGEMQVENDIVDALYAGALPAANCVSFDVPVTKSGLSVGWNTLALTGDGVPASALGIVCQLVNTSASAGYQAAVRHPDYVDATDPLVTSDSIRQNEQIFGVCACGGGSVKVYAGNAAIQMVVLGYFPEPLINYDLDPWLLNIGMLGFNIGSSNPYLESGRSGKAYLEMEVW